MRSMIAGQNVLCVMAKIGQWHVSNACDLNIHEAKELNVLAKDYTPKVNHKRDDQKE